MTEDYKPINPKPNPYFKIFKEEVYIDKKIIEYFKKLEQETKIPYPNLINFYLSDCVKNNSGPEIPLHEYEE